MLKVSEIEIQAIYRTCLISNQGRHQNSWRGRSKFWFKGQELTKKIISKRQSERELSCVFLKTREAA